MEMRNTALSPGLTGLLNGSAQDVAFAIAHADPLFAGHVLNTLTQHARQLMSSADPVNESTVWHAVSVCMHLAVPDLDSPRVMFLIDASVYYHAINQNQRGLTIALFALQEAEACGQKRLLRRAHSWLGGLFAEGSDYEHAAAHLDRSYALSLEIGDNVAAAAALNNASRMFSQMGVYREAIAAAWRGLQYADMSPAGQGRRLEIAINGLFCAMRSRDHDAALEFLNAGSEVLYGRATDLVWRALFEYCRAHYLIDTNDAETATELIQAARRDLMPTKNPRITIALDLADCLCLWATREPGAMARSRTRLRELYHLSKQTNVQHDDVLLALMRVYGTGVSPEEAKVGMEYARELVEYTTLVKRAKFYHQLSLRGVNLPPAPAKVDGPFDPFEKLRHMLVPPSTTDTQALGAMRAGNCESNEELTAIHGELAQIRASALRAEIRSTAYDAAENWAVAAEFFDDNTGEHCFRVGHLAGALAREIGMDDEFCVRIEHAARLHDIGKIAVNEMILLKPGPLNPVELTAMREHTAVGAELLANTQDRTLQMAAEIARYHHEWWNGAGYPASLSLTQIPLSARICALADVYDALTHVRSYKSAWPHEVAVQEIRDLSGLQFDPTLVTAFLRVLERFIGEQGWHATQGRKDVGTNRVMQARQSLMHAIETATAPA